MIDLDRMEEQLASALTLGARPAPKPATHASAPVPAPPPAPAPASVALPPRRRQRAVAPEPPRPARPAAGLPASPAELLESGLVEEADAAMARAGHPRDALCWATMRALLEGRQDAARTGIDELRRLADRTDDPHALDRWWLQRFWTAFEWGGDEERLDVLDHCRARAYRFDDLTWWGNLTLLLAAMGKGDEATRAFDDASALVARAGADRQRLDVDVTTNLVEAATILGDPGRADAAARLLHVPDGRLVVVGDGAVCKGSVDRYRALGHVAGGRWAQAGECFRRAESVHRALGAAPLLARTLEQASRASVAA